MADRPDDLDQLPLRQREVGDQVVRFDGGHVGHVVVGEQAGATRTSPLSGIALHHAHGATAGVAPGATAFGVRRVHYVVEIVTAWEPDGSPDGGAERHRAWTDAVAADLAGEALPGGYANLLAPDDHAQIAHAYGDNAARLLAAKAHYDADGVFTAIPLPSA
jgi:hypothetical protein